MKSCLFAFIATALFVAVPALAAILPEGTGIIYGEDHAFRLTAPKGWVLDNESAVSQGIDAVFYPKGGSWESSVVVAYARATQRTKEVNTADDAAKQVIEEFHAHGSPKYDGKRVKTIAIGPDREAVIYHFSGDKWGNSEAVAYFVEKKTINFVVLNSRKRKAFEAALPAFEKLVASYAFMGDSPLKGGAPQATPGKPGEPAK